MKQLKKNNISLPTLSLIIILFLNLNVCAQKDLVGKYLGNETNRSLIINPDGSFLLLNENRNVILYHIDTLSFGKWRIDGDFAILNTPKSIESRSLKVVVEENFIPNSDTLVLEILNPYEEYFLKYGGKRLFDYVFFIDSFEGKFGPEIFMKSNKTSLYKTKNDKIVNLNITIVPLSYLYPSTLAFNYLVSCQFDIVA